MCIMPGLDAVYPWAHSPLVSHVPSLPVSRLLGLALVSWASARVRVHRLFPLSVPDLGEFPFTLLYLPFNFIHVSSLRPTYLHPFGRPLLTF